MRLIGIATQFTTPLVMAYNDSMNAAPLDRLKRTLSLNNIPVMGCTFYRSGDYTRYYSVGGGYTLTTGTIGSPAVHSIEPYENGVLGRLVKIQNVC
jgi:hypothetical protein